MVHTTKYAQIVRPVYYLWSPNTSRESTSYVV